MADSNDVLPDIWSMVEPFFTSDPDHMALTSTGVCMTYQELKKNIEKLNNILKENLPESYKQESKRSLILHQPNSVSVILSMLTCVYMRQPFTPLPVDWPEDKQQMVFEDVKGAAVLTTEERLSTSLLKNAKILKKIEAKEISTERDIYLVYLEEYEGQIDIQDDCCYTIYTSGSTGRPKGVQCVRKGVSNLARGQIEFWDMCKEDVSGQFASVAYDAVISEVFVAFASGGTLAVIEPDERLGEELVDTVNELKISTITFVPSLLEVLDPERFPTITKLVTAGEACSQKLARKWYREGTLRMFNAYGPAENTVCATMYEVTEEKLDEGASEAQGLPIGKAMRGVYIRLLDTNLQEVSVGKMGEIYIGGQSLSKGYIGHASKMTDIRFIQDPANPGVRLYKSGDLAVKDVRGDLIYMGRVDNQIKIRGQMVNMEGIETVLLTFPGVELAAVVCQEGPKLVAFLSPKSLNLNVIKEGMKQKMSAYEIPDIFQLLDSKDFPRNNNDKIDRKILQTRPVE